MEYYLLDVFAEEKYKGNPLAVFMCDETLSAELMQRIALEFRFSEVVFIVGEMQSNNGFNVRIFTPDTELPYAGHPILGAAFIISNRYDLRGQIRINLKSGQILVDVYEGKAFFQQNSVEFGPMIPNEVIESVLGLRSDDFEKRLPFQIVSCGLPTLVVPLRCIEALQGVKVDIEKFDKYIEKYGKANILFYTLYENEIRARCFMDDPGHFEDPATGSANAALAGYMLKNQVFNNHQTVEYIVRQGIEMGRESVLNIRASCENGFRVRVGGSVQIIAHGEWFSEK